jgi:hypothetical protein
MKNPFLYKDLIMLSNKIFLKFFIATTFISIHAVNHTNTITTTIIEQRIETKIEPSFTQKIRAFVIENKPLFVGAFILSIIALYPKRAPLFIEWTLMNLMLHLLGNPNNHVSVHFNSIYSSYPTYWSPRPFWWF